MYVRFDKPRFTPSLYDSTQALTGPFSTTFTLATLSHLPVQQICLLSTTSCHLFYLQGKILRVLRWPPSLTNSFSYVCQTDWTISPVFNVKLYCEKIGLKCIVSKWNNFVKFTCFCEIYIECFISTGWNIFNNKLYFWCKSGPGVDFSPYHLCRICLTGGILDQNWSTLPWPLSTGLILYWTVIITQLFNCAVTGSSWE